MPLAQAPEPRSALAGAHASGAWARLEALHDPARARQALDELRSELETWRARDCGLGEPLDADLALASVLATSAFVADPEQAAELHLLLEGIRALVPADQAPDPALALALAHGWLVLADPRVTGPALDDPCEPLGFALRAARGIASADGRDGLGCRLALAWYECLSNAGRGAAAMEGLGEALAWFEGDLELRPYLLCRLADARRVQGDWRAWSDLLAAERAAAQLASRSEVPPILLRTLASTRCQLELACGLLDQAAETLELARAAVDAGADDAASRLALLLDESALALASAQRVPLEGAIQALAGRQDDEELFGENPGARAMVRARLALLEDMHADVAALAREATPAQRADDAASAALERALADPALDAAHRAELALRLVLRAQRADLALAEKRLALLPASGLAPEQAAALDAARARQARLGGASSEVLRVHRSRLAAHFEHYAAARLAGPAREGGFGFQAWRQRRLLLGERIALELALEEGEAGIEAALALVLEEQALGSMARLLAAEPGSPKRLRAELCGAQNGLLVYAPALEGLHLFVLDGRGSRHAYLPWMHEFEPGPRALLARLETSPDPLTPEARRESQAAIEGLASELAARLLPQVARDALAGWEGVYVCGLDLAGGIPVECLPLDGRPLGLRLNVASLPSLPVGLALARRAREAPERTELELLLLAAPEHDPSFGAPIPLARDQEAALAAGYRRRTVLRGGDASLAGLVQALARGGPDVLCLLVHGKNDPTRELSGGLVLAGGPVWCEELLAPSWTSPALVVLAACGSARGPRRVGDDGLAQLAGAFFQRGARCVLQARTDLALEPALAQLAGLGAELAQGRSPAAALRAARAELARSERFDHPFYLQALSAVGLGLEPFTRQ